MFRAADHAIADVSDNFKLREAKSAFGIALRYQERIPDPPDASDQLAPPEPQGCETGHSIFILSGRTEFD